MINPEETEYKTYGLDSPVNKQWSVSPPTQNIKPFTVEADKPVSVLRCVVILEEEHDVSGSMLEHAEPYIPTDGKEHFVEVVYTDKVVRVTVDGEVEMEDF